MFADHYGTLETTLDQGSNSTTLNLKLSGVPIGKEDETVSHQRFLHLPHYSTHHVRLYLQEQNLQTFYIRGLQAIGLGLSSLTTSHSNTSKLPTVSSVLPPPPLEPSSTTSSSKQRSSQRRKEKVEPISPRLNRWTFANVGTFIASAGLIFGMGAAFYYGPSGPGGKK